MHAVTGPIFTLIARKRDGLELTTDEIRSFVSGVYAGSVPDYQIGAMLMAIYLRGMADRETADLTMAMVDSGDIIDLSAIRSFKVDKHSTGGVGDTVTPVIGPLVASAGVAFPKLAGRGLGHTGGTLDKLESIPELRVDLSIEEFIRQVAAIGLAVTGQSPQLVPVDGILYGLRDVTATVESVPLIASSVMSKKIAAGADGIVLDVKCGRGAFVRTREEALALARLMTSIGISAGKRTTAIVTAMNEPLGRAVGNALEISEAIALLRGEPSAPADLRQVCLLLGAHVLVMAGQAPSIEEAKRILIKRLESGAALEKLREMIEWQGGNPRVIDDLSLLPRAWEAISVASPRRGYIQSIDALQVGELVRDLGAGRRTKEETVDHAVGVVLHVQAGDPVDSGQPLALIHTNHRIPNDQAVRALLTAFQIGPEPPPPQPHVLDVIEG